MSSQEEINYLLNDSIPFDTAKVNILTIVMSWMQSGDGNKINHANQILTRLKNSKTMFSNINQIMGNCTHTSTIIIYSLVAFEEQLNNYWNYLSIEQKQEIKKYFSTLFMSIVPTDDQKKNIIFRKVKSIVVKMFILDFSESDTFIENLIEQAKGEQFKCENILEVFSIMADEVETYGFFFLEKKYEQILTLAAMVLKSTQEGKVKSYLLKNAMTVLEKFCTLLKGAIFPHEIVVILLDIFKSNKLRIQICNLLAIVCNHSLQILVTIVQNVSTILDWNCSIEAYRNNIKAKANNQLTYTDLFLRAYTNLILKLIHGFLELRPADMNEYLKTCYGIIMCLSQSSDKDTWQTCRQAWITYLKIQTDLINLQYLSSIIVFKCQTPLSLSKNSLNHFKPKDDSQQQQENDQTDFSNLIFRLASVFWQNMYNKIWQFIESQTFVKFNKDLFISSTFAFCYLNKAMTDKNKIMNFLKLLMNISESVQVENKKTVVTQFLNVVSFYTSVVVDNFGLSTVLQDKYIENAQDSIKAFVQYSSEVKITPQGIGKIENKIQQLGHQQLSLQQLLYQIILKSQSNSTDIRLHHPFTIPYYLSTLLRNYAGFKIFSLTWNPRWDLILQIINSINSLPSTLSSSQKKYLSKVTQTTLKLLQLYCNLCLSQSMNPQTNLISNIFQYIKTWKGYQRLSTYIA